MKVIIKQKFIIDEEWEFLRGNSKFPTDLDQNDVRSLLLSAYNRQFEESTVQNEPEVTFDDEFTLEPNKNIEQGIRDENEAESDILKKIGEIDIDKNLESFLSNTETCNFFKILMDKYEEQQKQLKQLASFNRV